MYKEHEDPNLFKVPSDPNIKIWKYLTLPKLLHLLEYQSLYFSKLNKIGDPYEGSYPEKHYALEEKYADGTERELQESQIKFLKELADLAKKSIFVNCWHINEYESAAMWAQYTEQNQGIAIQSTFQKVKNSFTTSLVQGWTGIYAGEVSYIDYQKDEINTGNIFFPAVHKRKSFEHEKELRFVAFNFDSMSFKEDNLPAGYEIKINPDALIENIYVAPTCSGWFEKLIREIIQNRYQLKKEIIRSSLADSPLY